MTNLFWRRCRFLWMFWLSCLAAATPLHASEIWVAPTAQADVGGLGVASNTLWPVTPIGAVRLAWAIPTDLQTFQSAKIVLIPSASSSVPVLTFYLCPAQSSQSVTVNCAGPFTQGFTSTANQLLEIDMSAAVGAHLGTPGASYLSVLAYTTPTTSTDHIVGLRFAYTPKAPSGLPTLAANTFTGTQTAPAFVGDGSGLTNITLPNATITTAAGVNNAFFGNLAGAANTAVENSFFGSGAGRNNTQGNDNSFFGEEAGFSNTTGLYNAFFGAQAGRSNTQGIRNSFVGNLAGFSNSSGNNNTYVGERAGWTTDASNNAFFGSSAGKVSFGSNNSFFGAQAGCGCALAAEQGSGNSFFGESAGQENVDGSSNAFFGINSGFHNVEGSNNTLIGAYADVLNDPLTNANAIGANALVTQSNSLVLGSINGLNNATADTNVGIGTTAPASRLHVNGSVRVTNGSVYVSNPNTLIITSPNGACWGITVNNGGAVSAFSTPCPP